MLKIIDFLKLPSLGQSYMVAGYDGIFNVIKKLEIMEEPYPSVLPYLVPSGFMLTNFWSMKEDKEGRYKLVKSMIDHRCAGFGIMPWPHLNDIVDDEIVELANKHGFPIIYISSNCRWGNIISEYGVLAYSDMSSSLDSRMGDALSIFAEFHDDSNIGRFCRNIGKFLDLPVIMSTNTVYSSDSGDINVAVLIAKIQAVCQQSRSSLTSPISIRFDDIHLALVYFGKRSLVAACIPNSTLNSQALQLFHKIAPTAVKELDKFCANSYNEWNHPAINNLDDTPMFYLLIKRKDVENVEKKLDYKYIIYEKNQFFHYCILLIPNQFKKLNEVYSVLQELFFLLKPDLFIFSKQSFSKRELLNEIEPLKYAVNTLSYLQGIYSSDELPLLYILSYVPYEYKSHLFPSFANEKLREEEKMFMDTLRLYLVIHTISDVASLLGIHGNSVKYRIRKALKYFGYKGETVLGEVPYIKLLMQLEFLIIDD